MTAIETTREFADPVVDETSHLHGDVRAGIGRHRWRGSANEFAAERGPCGLIGLVGVIVFARNAATDGGGPNEVRNRTTLPKRRGGNAANASLKPG